MNILSRHKQAPSGLPRRRRRVAFRTPDEITADAIGLSSRSAIQLGNWSLGQICRHLATAMCASIDEGESLIGEYPRWHWRLGPFFKHYILSFGLRPGYRLKGKLARLLVPGPTETADGIRELMDAVQRLKVEPRRIPRHVLGRFSREDWDRYHLRHAELHLSFIVPVDGR